MRVEIRGRGMDAGRQALRLEEAKDGARRVFDHQRTGIQEGAQMRRMPRPRPIPEAAEPGGGAACNLLDQQAGLRGPVRRTGAGCETGC